ncbi:hypothetical protein EQP59_05250 [Ornithobacterium rhinotracheale]|uniref:Uncharacterized protein n=1 Tax=Ornithobacterium rhinotracheale TaxID=28251 RepID=A0A3R5XUH8_ORNRH|nr:hypothetical protein [Ornithobacterium rhinotracheale]QAR30785.1 hypothetical protein EQP59_05250 [Ornithobacterium rhinotracheale]
MKKLLTLCFAFVLSACNGQNQKEMNNKAQELLGNLYKNVEYRDEAISNHMVVSSGGATVEVYINGYPIHREPVVIGKRSGRGMIGGSNPINEYILKSGVQEWEVRVYPAYSMATKSQEKTLSENTRFIMRLEKLRFTDNGVEHLAPAKVIIETPMVSKTTSTGNTEQVYKDAGKPMAIYKGTFIAEVPYILKGWSESVDLTKEDPKKLKEELVEKYQELWNILDKRRTDLFAEKILKRETETAQALFYTKVLNDDYMNTFFENVGKEDKKMDLLKDYKMVFYGKYMISLEHEKVGDLPYLPALSAVYNDKTDEGTIFTRYITYYIAFHRPKPGAPLEIIR